MRMAMLDSPSGRCISSFSRRSFSTWWGVGERGKRCRVCNASVHDHQQCTQECKERRLANRWQGLSLDSPCQRRKAARASECWRRTGGARFMQVHTHTHKHPNLIFLQLSHHHFSKGAHQVGNLCRQHRGAARGPPSRDSITLTHSLPHIILSGLWR